jgi:raffinose/stachyose/melibiose transport system substrate-binding protein
MRKGIIVLVALLALFAVVGNGWAQEKKLVFWTTLYQEGAVGTDSEMKDWYIYQAIKRFEAANPGVKVQVVFQSADNYFELFKSTALAKQAPDLGCHWPGGNTQGLKEFILPLNKYFSKKEIDNFRVVLPSWKDYKVGGDFLAVPLGWLTVGLYYNKDLFKKAGLPLETEFKDINDFMAACEKLKRAGIDPIVIGEKEGYQSTWFAAKMFMGRLGPEFAYDASAGRRSLEDPALIEAYRKWNEVFKKGLLNPDVVSMSVGDTGAFFTSGKTAMQLDGTWALTAYAEALGDKLGFIRTPPLAATDKYKDAMVSSCESNIYVTNQSKNPDLAVKFVKFLVSDAEMKTYTMKIGTFSSTKSIPDSQYTDPIRQKIAAYLSKGTIVPFIENVTSKQVEHEWLRLNPLALSGALSPEELAKDLQQVNLANPIK